MGVLADLAAQIRAAGSPTAWVIEVVASVAIGMVLAGVAFTADAILDVGRIVALAFAIVRDVVVAILAPIGEGFVSLLVGIQTALAGLATGAGPLAPVAVAFGWSLLLLATVGVAKLVVRVVL